MTKYMEPFTLAGGILIGITASILGGLALFISIILSLFIFIQILLIKIDKYKIIEKKHKR